MAFVYEEMVGDPRADSSFRKVATDVIVAVEGNEPDGLSQLINEGLEQ